MKSTGALGALGLVLLGLVGYVSNTASAAPTCKRVASQWAAVFKAKCTQWYREGNERVEGHPPPGCTQQLEGDLAVDDWPWNDDIAVVHDEDPADNFTSVRPEQDVTHYGAGLVVVQSTWDMVPDEGTWQARHPGQNASQQVGARADYISANEGHEKFLSCTVDVRYEPPSFSEMHEHNPASADDFDGHSTPRRRLIAEEDEGHEEENRFTEQEEAEGHLGAYEFGYEDRDLQETLHLPPGYLPEEFFPEDPAKENGFDDDDNVYGGLSYSSFFSYSNSYYYVEYIHSYEEESYAFSYSMELEDLGSYSYSYITEEGQESEGVEGRPDDRERMKKEKGRRMVNPEAVQSVTSVDIYLCTDEANTQAEVRWHCDPDEMGSAQCYEAAGGPNRDALQIHGFEMYCSPACLSEGGGGVWCDIFGLDGCRMCTQDCVPVCGDGLEDCRSCVKCPSDPTEAPPTVPPTVPPTAAITPSPTVSSGSPGSRDGEDFETPTPVMTMMPTAVSEEGILESAAPTSSSRGEFFDTAAPTVGMWDGEGAEFTASPTMPGMKERGFSPEVTAAPTHALLDDDVPFVECTPGDAQSCYDQIPPNELGLLEASGRGMTCEESCIAMGGPWCKAYDLDGCRFCQADCDDFCHREGLPEDCLCFECD